jgi:hypothetical protein
MSHSMKSPWLQDNRRQIGMEAAGLLRKIAQELQLTEEDLIRQGLRAFLEQRIRELRAEWIEITGRYGVAGVEEMEARYREGTLEEADTWRDLQRLDRLEYQIEQLQRLLETLS